MIDSTPSSVSESSGTSESRSQWDLPGSRDHVNPGRPSEADLKSACLAEDRIHVRTPHAGFSDEPSLLKPFFQLAQKYPAVIERLSRYFRLDVSSG